MRLLSNNSTAGAFPCLGNKLENPSKSLLELLRISTLFTLGK